MIHLGNHDNIVNILGACTRGGNLGAIMDFCPHGNLVHFLRDRRDIFSLQWAKQADSYEEDFCFFDAAHVALQIARGMAFLSEKKVGVSKKTVKFINALKNFVMYTFTWA